MTVAELIARLQEVQNKEAQVSVTKRTAGGQPKLVGILDLEDWTVEEPEFGVLILPKG
jgi:hypothetical protein